eukprot:16123416-Heterocapsa_arctica.AAC.1
MSRHLETYRTIANYKPLFCQPPLSILAAPLPERFVLSKLGPAQFVEWSQDPRVMPASPLS